LAIAEARLTPVGQPRAGTSARVPAGFRVSGGVYDGRLAFSPLLTVGSDPFLCGARGGCGSPPEARRNTGEGWKTLS
jgi:hypothetical protein